MELEKVTAEIRPRGDWEAIDLGLSLTREHVFALLKGWAASVLPVSLIIFALNWGAMGWGIFLVWWLKPVWERVALYRLSRSLFGEHPTWKESARVLPKELADRKILVIMGIALTAAGRFVHHESLGGDSGLIVLFWLTVFGLAFYRSLFDRSLDLPMKALEGLSGPQLKLRKSVLSARSSGSAMGLTVVCLLMEIFLFASHFWFIYLMMPEGAAWNIELLISDFFLGGSDLISPWVGFFVAIFYFNSMSLVAWFYVGGGFGLYVNSRTWTEGWDIELNFKRLGLRLGKKVGQKIGLVLAMILLSQTVVVPAEAQEARERAEQVLADDDFDVRTRKIEKPKEDSSDRGRSISPSMGIFAGIGEILFWLILVAAVAGIIYVIVKNAGLLKGDGPSENIKDKAKVSTIAGMNIEPEKLPKNLLAEAQRLWAAGQYQEALSLLYRGAISTLVDRQIVEIEESDTEMDCLRRVQARGEEAHASYFQLLTNAWISQAYASSRPDDQTVGKLWSDWPFLKAGERRTP